MSTFGGAPNPYGSGQPNEPHGSGGPQPADPYRGAGGTPPSSTDQGPYTHRAPGAAPSGSYSTPSSADQTYLRPGAYGSHGPYGAGYGGYPPLQNKQNSAGGWALGLGIASLLMCLVPVLSQLVAVAGIVTGVMGVKAASEGRADNRGMATTGIVLSAVALVLGIALVVGWAGWWTAVWRSVY